jgi:hypothetical protein
MFEMFMGKTWTSIPVKVIEVETAGTLTVPAVISIQPLVHQTNGKGDTTPHGIIHGVPCWRLQGGRSGVVIDPVVGDVGVALFAQRDISTVMSSRQASPPGSRRRHDPSDAIYFGSILGVGQALGRYLLMNTSGITMLDPTKITIHAPDIELEGAVHVTGALTGDSTAAFTGNVTGNGHSLSTHVHGGVTTGGGSSTGPIG